MPTVSDRIVLGNRNPILSSLVDPRLSSSAYGYRKRCGLRLAVEYARKLIGSGLCCVLSADIKNCFPSVCRSRLAADLAPSICDSEFAALLEELIRSDIQYEDKIIGSQGLPTGVATLPVPLDLHLAEPDKELHAQVGPFVRYADNYFIPCPTREQCARALSLLR